MDNAIVMEIQVKPSLLRWARERATFTPEHLAKKLNVTPEKVAAWEKTGAITFAKLKDLADDTRTPIGYLFLPEPPVEKLPIPDFRTVGSSKLQKPSVDLIDVIHQCQLRQTWYRDYLIETGADELAYVGSATVKSDVISVATSIRQTLKIDLSRRSIATGKDTAFRYLVELCEGAGLLIMRGSVVGSNNTRKLSVEEFRGFALVDPYAPLVFINTADTPTASSFTLAHELAHIWIGKSGVSNSNISSANGQDTERFCNAVAAEILVPLAQFQAAWKPNATVVDEIERLSNTLAVSRFVVLRRAKDAQLISDEVFQANYALLVSQYRGRRTADGGGNYFATAAARVGKRLTSAVIGRVVEGKVTYTEAFSLLGVSSTKALRELATAVKLPIPANGLPA